MVSGSEDFFGNLHIKHWDIIPTNEHVSSRTSNHLVNKTFHKINCTLRNYFWHLKKSWKFQQQYFLPISCFVSLGSRSAYCWNLARERQSTRASVRPTLFEDFFLKVRPLEIRAKFWDWGLKRRFLVKEDLKLSLGNIRSNVDMEKDETKQHVMANNEKRMK